MAFKKNEGLEISSAQIHADLLAIKDRIAALETISTLANRPVVEAYVKSCLPSDILKKIMTLCEQPKTKEELRVQLGMKSIPALDHHLNQIREYDLLQPDIQDGGKLTFRWSNLFSRLPKRTIESLLNTERKIKAGDVSGRRKPPIG